MRILITGGAGFIGSHLCDHFLEQGFEVIAVDNLITGDMNNLKHLIDNPRFTFINHDISLPLEKLEAELKKRDLDGDLYAVLNFASLASPPYYLKYPIETLQVASYGTHNTLDLARKKNARYLFASTSEIYGDPLEHPQKETYLGNVNPIGVRGVYDEGKRYAEALTMAYHRKFNLPTYIVRIFNTYGPRMTEKDGRVVPNFIVQALNGKPLTVYGGQQTRSFQYIDDLIRGISLLLKSDYHFPVNIGNTQEITILELAKIINKLTGNTAGVVIINKDKEDTSDDNDKGRIPDDPERRCPDISLAKEQLGWEPKISLEEGLKRTIDYFKGLDREE